MLRLIRGILVYYAKIKGCVYLYVIEIKNFFNKILLTISFKIHT